MRDDKRKYGYNISRIAGRSGKKHITKKHKKQISQALKGRTFTDETKKKMSITNRKTVIAKEKN